MSTEHRWDETVPLDIDKIKQLQEGLIQTQDLEFLCKAAVNESTDVDPGVQDLLKVFQQGLRKAVIEREAALHAKGRADQLLAESRRGEVVVSPSGAVQPEAIRARDQHILYLQYEVSQRDLQMQQLVEQAQQSRNQIEGLEEQKRLLEEEVEHVRGQISKARDESDQLRQSIENQLRKTETREKIHNKNEELITALEDAANLRLEAQRQQNMCNRLEQELRDATVQIDNATAEHLLLKNRVEITEATCEELRDENFNLREKIKNDTIQGTVRSPEPSHSTSNADEQLDQLIAIVNKRVDEWKSLMDDQPQVNDTVVNHSRNAADTERLLAMRTEEVSLLRASLSNAVHEIEEGADAIIRLKQKRRVSSLDVNDDLRSQLANRASELSNMLKRILALEDDLDLYQRENKELHFQIQRYEQGVYGLSEAKADQRKCQSQLTNRDKYIKELVRRLNILTADYDLLLLDYNETRRDSGLPPRQSTANRNFDDMAHLLDGRLLVEVLEDQIDHLETERISLRKTIHSLMGHDLAEDERGNAQYQTQPRRMSDRSVDELLDDIKILRRNYDGLVEENRHLEQSMQEILDAIRESRVRSPPGQSVELRSPALEALLKIMERRRAQSRDSAYTETHVDSTVDSEQEYSQESAGGGKLREKTERLLSGLEDIARRNSSRPIQEGSLNGVSDIPERIKFLFNKGMQDVLRLALDSDSRSLGKLIKGYQVETQLLLDDLAQSFESAIRDQKRKLERLSDDHATLPAQHQRCCLAPKASTFQQDSLVLDQLRETEIRLARGMDIISVMSAENRQLREQISKSSSHSSQDITQGLTALEKDHRNEVDTLARINNDLRTDARRHETHIAELRTSLQAANEQLLNLAGDLKRSQSQISRTEQDVVNDAGNGDHGTVCPSGRDDIGTEVRQRVVAQLEAKIQRLEKELIHREADRQKDRDEFMEALSRSGKGLQSDVEFSRQIAALHTDLGQRDRRMEILTQQLDNAKSELHSTTESFAKREQENRKARENLENHYEQTITRLRDDLNKLQQPSVPRVLVSSDSARTFTQADGALVVPGQPPLPESRIIKSLSDQLTDKDQQLKNLTTAFQAFKDEMTALPSANPTVVSQLTSQKRQVQGQLTTAREENSKVLADLRKQKTEVTRLTREIGEMRIVYGQRDQQLHRFEVMNGEYSTKVAALEDELSRLKSGLTDDDRTVAELRRKIAVLEKNRRKSKSQSPTRVASTSSSKPEIRVWEERKKWETVVQKLKDQLKERDTEVGKLEAALLTAKEAYSRSERDRGLMEKRLASLSKRISDLSHQPEYLQQSLDASLRETEELKTLLEKLTIEKELLEERVLRLQAQEANYISTLKTADERVADLIYNDKTQTQKHTVLRERAQKKIKALEKRVLELETAIAETKNVASNLPIPKVTDNSKDLLAAARKLKEIVDDQQAELQQIRQENATLRHSTQKRLQSQKAHGTEMASTKQLASTVKVLSPKQKPQPQKVQPTSVVESRAKRHQVVGPDRNEGTVARKTHSSDLYGKRRISELETQLANILGQRDD